MALASLVSFWKAKAKAKASVENIAKDLINLYAERKNGKGFAFAPDTPWQKEFEDAFPYEETPDQLKAIAEIKADMEKLKFRIKVLNNELEKRIKQWTLQFKEK